MCILRRLFPGSPLSCSAGLGSLGRPSRKNLVTNRVVCQKSGKIWFFFRESHANMRLMGGFGSQNGNPQGFCPGKEVPKTIFECGGQVCRIISDKKFGDKKRNPLGNKLGERGPQSHFRKWGQGSPIISVFLCPFFVSVVKNYGLKRGKLNYDKNPRSFFNR
jgi:hypothetical protein